MKKSTTSALTLLVGAFAAIAPEASAQAVTAEPPMMRGDTAATNNGWSVQPVLTVSESYYGYLAPGILDGIGAFPGPSGTLDLLVNHELGEGNGYAYQLANGTMLTGARVSRFIIGRDITSGTPQYVIRRAGAAYNRAYDRSGQLVTSAAQINETGDPLDGFARLCSSQAVRAGTYGFVDDIYFTGEETGKPFHPHGGTEWALDVHGAAIWGVPAMGRMAWENVTPIDSGDDSTVAILCGDDSASAPLYLYVGEKDAVGDGSFLDRNGLVVGKLYAWAADNGDLDPETFNGLNESRTGTFVEVTVQDTTMAGQPGYDAAGYADIDTLQAEADALGCFSFSRPEDVATNPLDATQAVLASTGRGQLFPSDNWGTLYVVDVDVQDLSALLVIVHDCDDLPVPDAGIRNPDNLDWASDGKIYVQEDRSTSPSSLFGGTTGIDASIWQLDPITRAFTRVAEMDRTAVVPSGTTDGCAGSLGCWESSGVLDVTAFLPTFPGELLLVADVQAHGIEDGPIGGNALLDEGGQIVFVSNAR